MNHRLQGAVLRRPEPRDLDALYAQKNDPAVSSLLGGFSTGYSRADLEQWLEFHRKQKDEVLWVVAEEATDRCLGHVGLYQIDHRVRSAEFAIMLGDPAVWGKGLGRACTRFAVEYGFGQLNLNRIHLSVLSSNDRAIRLYRGLGFVEEGRLRQGQYKDGRYVDVVIMGLLREEYERP
jgi:RimJ/RimL family protein N-acetyltransferase